jgi:23S rRNA pseudoU1915 N3-methylase RlmH
MGPESKRENYHITPAKTVEWNGKKYESPAMADWWETREDGTTVHIYQPLDQTAPDSSNSESTDTTTKKDVVTHASHNAKPKNQTPHPDATTNTLHPASKPAATNDRTAKPIQTIGAGESSQNESLLKKGLDFVIDATPFIGSGRDIYRGIKKGNWLDIGIGVVGLFLDLGGGSLIKAGAKQVVKAVEKAIVKRVEKIVAKKAESLAAAALITQGTNATSKIINTSFKQLEKKFKHAIDFGITGNSNRANWIKFHSAINQHLNAAGTQIIHGAHRGSAAIFHYNPKTGLNVITDLNGKFVSGWKLTPGQANDIVTKKFIW